MQTLDEWLARIAADNGMTLAELKAEMARLRRPGVKKNKQKGADKDDTG